MRDTRGPELLSTISLVVPSQFCLGLMTISRALALHGTY